MFDWVCLDNTIPTTWIISKLYFQKTQPWWNWHVMCLAVSVFWPNKYPTRFCVVLVFLSISSVHFCQCISLHVERLDLEPVTASLFGSTLWAVQHWPHQCVLSSRACSAFLELERRNGTYTKTLYKPEWRGCFWRSWFRGWSSKNPLVPKDVRNINYTVSRSSNNGSLIPGGRIQHP